MIFKKATPTPTNILRMLANGYVDVDVLRINMLSSVFPSVAVPWVYIEKLWGVRGQSGGRRVGSGNWVRVLGLGY